MSSPKPALLCIDTALRGCSVAIVGKERDDILYSRVDDGIETSNAVLIGSYCQEALLWLSEHDYTLSAVAVTDGPGSYTGLRIGASIAKGLAFGAKVPLIAVSTLQLLASQRRGQEVEILSLIDAGHGNAYAQLFNRTNAPVDTAEFVAITPEWLNQIKIDHPSVHIIYTGSLPLPHDATLGDTPDAVALTVPARTAWIKEQYVDVAYWEPNYVKPYHAVTSKNKVLERLQLHNS